MGSELRRVRLFSSINIPRRPLRGRGTRARASARGSACATDPCGASGVSGTAFNLSFAFVISVFIHLADKRMADDFANGRNFFGEIRLDSHFPVPSFAGGRIGWPAVELEGGDDAECLLEG